MEEHQFEEPIYPPLRWEPPVRRPAGLPERDRFPVDPERRRRSARALYDLRQEHQKRDDGSFPWRAKLLTATALPATLRTWTDVRFDLDDDRGQEMAQTLFSTGLRSGALFGEVKADRFAEEFVATPIIKVGASRKSGDDSVMRHFGWRQIYRGLPVLGGSGRVHEVTGDRRICLTSSYFPVEDAPPNLEASIGAVECVWIALFCLLETGAVDPETVPATMLPRFFQERRWNEAADFLRFLEWQRAGLGGGELSGRLWEALAEWHERGEGNDAAAEALARVRDWLREHPDSMEAGAEVVPIQGSELAIVPWAGQYVLARRVEVRLPRQFPWYVDIDVNAGEVLGAPWQAVIGAPAYVTTSAEAAAEQATGDAANIDTGRLAAYVEMWDGNQPVPMGPGVKLPSNLSDDTPDAATVVVHGQRLLVHLQDRCGAQLPAPNPKVRVFANSQESTGFSYGPGARIITFERDAGAHIAVAGKTVFFPGRDPEVVMHEFAHAFLWLLNDDPWDTASNLTPFGRALQEGYAMYLSRSLADQDGDNQDQHWARGAYRPQNASGTTNWGDRWRLDRSAKVVGADLLPAPNVYPAGEYSSEITLEDYDVGMVWARALWDLRTVVGPSMADRLAVRAYPYLHGWLTSFELAAEAFINADAQVSELDLTNGTQPLWAGRGIAAGQGVYGFAQAQNALLIAAGDAGILRSVDGGASWALEVNNLAGGGTLTGVVAVAADDNHLYTIAELPPPQAVGSDRQWNPGVYWRDLDQANGLWQEVPNWPNDITPLCLARAGAGQMLVGSNRGVYALVRDATNHHTLTSPQNTADAKFPALHLAVFAENNDLRVQAAAPNRLHESVLDSQGAPDSIWVPSSNSLFDGGEKTRIAAFAAQGTRLIAGVIPPSATLALRTLWELNPAWTNRTAIGNLVDPPLALAVNANRLWVATATNVFEQVGSGALVGLGLPITGAQILSLAATATHLLAGTLAHGIWRRPLAGGAWDPLPAYAPPQPVTVTVPAEGGALFSFLLGAANPAFTIEPLPGSPVQVGAVFQVGFPPGNVRPGADNAYNLQAGAVVVVLHNSDNGPHAVGIDRSNSTRLRLT